MDNTRCQVKVKWQIDMTRQVDGYAPRFEYVLAQTSLRNKRSIGYASANIGPKESCEAKVPIELFASIFAIKLNTSTRTNGLLMPIVSLKHDSLTLCCWKDERSSGLRKKMRIIMSSKSQRNNVFEVNLPLSSSSGVSSVDDAWDDARAEVSSVALVSRRMQLKMPPRCPGVIFATVHKHALITINCMSSSSCMKTKLCSSESKCFTTIMRALRNFLSNTGHESIVTAARTSSIDGSPFMKADGPRFDGAATSATSEATNVHLGAPRLIN